MKRARLGYMRALRCVSIQAAFDFSFFSSSRSASLSSGMIRSIASPLSRQPLLAEIADSVLDGHMNVPFDGCAALSFCFRGMPD
jgi:hypothetical protein